MNSDALTEIGFTKREAQAYLALLQLEEAKAGQIAEYTREDRTNVYDSLKSLVKKGLANYVIKNNKTYYRISSPSKLKDYLVEKEKILQEVLPDIYKIYKSYKPKPVIEVYEGKEGIKTVLSDILRGGEDFVGFGATDRASILLPEFTRRYLKEREKKNIKARQFYPEGENVLKSKLSVFRPMPKEFSSLVTTLIYKDKVALFMWFIEPPVVLLIKNKEAADTYKNQFEFMWKMTRVKI